MAADSAVVTRYRKGAQVLDDIRPAVIALRVIDVEVSPVAGVVWLEADLACQPRTLRPSEVLAALGPDLEERDVRRLHQWISRDGARWEPLGLPSDATSAPHAWERAS